VSRRENDLDNLYLPEYLSLPGHEFGGSVGGGQSGRIAGTRKLSSGGSGAEAAANKTLGLSSRWISPAHSLVSHVPQVISRGAGGPPLAPHGLGLQEEGGKGFDFPHGSCLYNLLLPGLESVGNASGSWRPEKNPLISGIPKQNLSWIAGESALPMIVGILGGIGSGKSTVTSMMVEMGAEAIDADALAHEVLEAPWARKALVEWLGPEALEGSGQVNRAYVAKRVFAKASDLQELEKLVHPEVIRRVEGRVKEHVRQKKEGDLLVLDVPLLLASPLKMLCQRLIFVEAREEIRKQRVEAKGWRPGELEARERFQTNLEEKKQLADHVINNSGSLEETRRQVEALLARLKAEGDDPNNETPTSKRKMENNAKRR